MDNVYIHMNGRHVILVFEIERYKFVGVLDAVNKVTAALNHTLIDQFAERLCLTNITIVIEEFIPKTAVNQVTGSMLGTTHIEIHLTPVLIGFMRYKFLIVVGIHVAQVIGR